MRAGLALIVLVFNVVALVSLFGAPIAVGRKLAWTAAVLLLPILGAGGWMSLGRSRLERDAGQ